MNDRRTEIPSSCWVNVAIIDRLQNTEEFVRQCITVPREAGIKLPVPGQPWPFMNLSWGAYMMYCLLVVPKELYNLPKEDSFYRALRSRQAMKDFTIRRQRKTFDQDPHYHLKSLRNAVAHVHFEVDSSDTFLFWDYDPRTPDNRHWEASIKADALIRFLHVIADETHKIYMQMRAGLRDWPNTT